MRITPRSAAALARGVSSATLLSLAALLASCALGQERPKIVSPPPPGIAYRFHSSPTQVEGKAKQYCGQWGKQPKLDSIEPAGSERIAKFDCV